MKTLLHSTLLVCALLMPLQHSGEALITPKQANNMIEQHKLDKLDTQFLLYESGIEMNLSEIKLILMFKKQPFRVLK